MKASRGKWFHRQREAVGQPHEEMTENGKFSQYPVVNVIALCHGNI